jgi:hypothetical protein
VLGEPLRLHRKQSDHRQLRGVGVEFAVSLVHVDHDALGIEPVGILAGSMVSAASANESPWR